MFLFKYKLEISFIVLALLVLRPNFFISFMDLLLKCLAFKYSELKFSLILLKIEFAAFVDINCEITMPTRVSNWFFLFGLKTI